MTLETLAIPVAFVLVVAGLLWLIIYAKGWWWLKIIYMVIVLSFGLMIWKNIESYRGWPTIERTPQRFILLWTDVQEPEQKIGFDGAIYVWLVPYEKETPEQPGVFDYHPGANEPRAHKLPYTRKTHEQMEKAKMKIRQGKIVVMERREGKEGEGEIGESEEGKEQGDGGKKGQPGDSKKGGRKGAKGGHRARPYDEFFFYEMPPPALPDKSL